MFGQSLSDFGALALVIAMLDAVRAKSSWNFEFCTRTRFAAFCAGFFGPLVFESGFHCRSPVIARLSLAWLRIASCRTGSIGARQPMSDELVTRFNVIDGTM